jgi:hypothetical protein
MYNFKYAMKFTRICSIEFYNKFYIYVPAWKFILLICVFTDMVRTQKWLDVWKENKKYIKTKK